MQEAYDIEKETVANEHFRRVLWTGKYQQLVLMSLNPGETIDMEVHETVDQFFRVEQGDMIVRSKNGAAPVHVAAGCVTNVRAGTWHEVIAGDKGTKLYTIYAPPNHPANRVDKVKPAAEQEHH